MICGLRTPGQDRPRVEPMVGAAHSSQVSMAKIAAIFLRNLKLIDMRMRKLLNVREDILTKREWLWLAAMDRLGLKIV
jgi:hypothetical protein